MSAVLYMGKRVSVLFVKGENKKKKKRADELAKRIHVSVLVGGR